MSKIESFENFIAEYYISAAPGSIVVPGEWYKDNVNSVNYVSKTQPLPQVVDTMFETDDVYLKLDQLILDKDFDMLIKKNDSSSKDIIQYIKNWLMQNAIK
jgi:hypothetical protein